MSPFEHTEVAINVPLFKLFCFYHLFNPNIKTIFNCNPYRLIIVLLVFSIQCFLILGVIIFLTGIQKDDFDHTHKFHVMLFVLMDTVNMIRVFTFIHKANDIWDLFDVTRINFLTSKQCHKYIGLLRKYRQKSIQMTNIFFLLFVFTVTVWIFFPFINYFKNIWTFGIKDANIRDSMNNKRTENILNCMFPVSIHVYNTYYLIFYFIELMMTAVILCIQFFYQMFFISLSAVFIAQYEVIAQAFINIDYSKRINSIGETNIFILIF